ncbi:UNKNOWN [Stylonychia lemnae]|uniref:Uncharacterized protein n=1 Tax=Stylonychia lemnae TaxID=5949 RepID=A0A078A7F5_STYLE|nr:UNKNOWN [Stylonychia lemnae]|eukprot:CDW77477.1 UNKNOWN [Stylonychia lemnae]
MLNRNHEYQCSLYTTAKQREQQALTQKQKELRAKLQRQTTVIKEETASSNGNYDYGLRSENREDYLTQIEQTTKDLEEIQKQIQKKENEQSEQLSKDAYQAMMTASFNPDMELARRTKDFIQKERIKKNSSKDFLYSRVDVFFKDKLKEAQEKDKSYKYQRLLNKIASQSIIEDQKTSQHHQSQAENKHNIFTISRNSAASRPFTAFTKFGAQSIKTDTQLSRFKQKIYSISSVSSQQQLQGVTINILSERNENNQIEVKSIDDPFPEQNSRQSAALTKFKTHIQDKPGTAIKAFHPYYDTNPKEGTSSTIININKLSIPNRPQSFAQSRISEMRQSLVVNQHNESENDNFLQPSINQENMSKSIQRPQTQGISNHNMETQKSESNFRISRPKSSSQRADAKKRLLKSASGLDILKRNMVSISKEPQYMSHRLLVEAKQSKEQVQKDVVSLIVNCKKFQRQAKSKSFTRKINQVIQLVIKVINVLQNYNQYQRQEKRMTKEIENLKDDIMMARLEKFNYMEDLEEIKEDQI